MSALRPALRLVVLSALLLAAGCSGSGQARYSSAQEAYEQGMAAYEDGDYEKAIPLFRAVFSYGRANEWADDAQLNLANAYREDGRYLLAASEYGRFAQLYRSDERAARAEFERAMAYYQLSPDFELAQDNTRKALSFFQLFIDRYPGSDLTVEAGKKIEELREKLAHKQYESAKLYERRELWEAAALSYETVFDQYPETSWVDNALVGAMRSYIAYAEASVKARQEERYQKAVDNYQRLKQTLPDSPLLDEAQQLYDTAQNRLGRIEEEEALANTDE